MKSLHKNILLKNVNTFYIYYAVSAWPHQLQQPPGNRYVGRSPPCCDTRQRHQRACGPVHAITKHVKFLQCPALALEKKTMLPKQSPRRMSQGPGSKEVSICPGQKFWKCILTCFDVFYNLMSGHRCCALLHARNVSQALHPDSQLPLTHSNQRKGVSRRNWAMRLHVCSSSLAAASSPCAEHNIRHTTIHDISNGTAVAWKWSVFVTLLHSLPWEFYHSTTQFHAAKETHPEANSWTLCWQTRVL